MLRRHQIPWRRLIKDSANPINQSDLENLAARDPISPFVIKGNTEEVVLHCRLLTVEDLPDGFEIDKFGLIPLVLSRCSLFWVAVQYGRKIGGKQLAEIPSDVETMSLYIYIFIGRELATPKIYL